MAGARRADPGWLEYDPGRRLNHGMDHALSHLQLLFREAHVTGRLALLPALELSPTHNFGVSHDWQWEWYFDLAASRMIDADGKAYPPPIANRHPPQGVRTLIVGPGEPIPPLARGYPRVVRRYASFAIGRVPGVPNTNKLRFELVHSRRVRDLAREAVGEIAALTGGRFVAIHVRRRDRLWQYPASSTEPEGIRNRLRDRIPDGSAVFVMSDERDPNFWEPLKRHYRLLRYTDFPRLAALVSREGGRRPDNYLQYAVEKEIAKRAWMRIGTFPAKSSLRGVGHMEHALVDSTQWTRVRSAPNPGDLLRRPEPGQPGSTPPASASAGGEARPSPAGPPASGDAPWPPTRQAPGFPVRARPPVERPPAFLNRTEYTLGVEVVAVGARAQAVFPLSSRVTGTAHGQRSTVALADTAAEAAGVETPTVVLAEAPPHLSVPAIDPCADNPIGWERRGRRTVAALGPLDRLPPSCAADRVVWREARVLLRKVHHIEDVQAFHGDTVARAGELVRLAASGVVVHLADGDRRLAPYVGPELFELMTHEVRDLDRDGREALSIRMRRAALREHSLRSRARQIAERALSDPPRLPLVSILLVTRRPALLERALSAVRRQTYPRLELILGLHGEGFGDVPAGAAGPSVPLTVLRLDAGLTLGLVLDALTEASRGTLLARMEDDDLYGTDHVWDLVLAQEYSQAPLVGKGAEFLYLAASDRTIRRPTGGAEQYETVGSLVAGAALLVTRQVLDVIGGWKRSRRAVEQDLVDNVVRAGERVYRTHSRGFMQVRHGRGHAGEVDDAYFLAQADVDEPGWHPELAGVGNASPPLRS